jgi:polyphenol oxidase
MSMPTETITKQAQNSKLENQSEDQILAENGFYWREKDGVKILVSRALEEKGFVNGFSTRLGGVSPFPKNDLNLAGFNEDTGANIHENRKRFLRAFDGDFLLATVWQVHGDTIKILNDELELMLEDEQADALVSNLPNILVSVKTADCVPVLIGDAKTKAFAAIHAGWRGTAQSIVPKTITKLEQEFGAKAEDLTVAIGAAATACCYEIGQDVIDAFEQNFPNSKHLFTPTRAGHALVDLHQANKEQLINSGVLPENIFIAPLCTMERTDLFFSYRVEKKLHGKTGRLLSVIGRKETE